MTTSKTLVISYDHGGFSLKDSLIKTATALQWIVVDVGPSPAEGSVDYPDFAQKGVEIFLKGQANYGLLICGTGIGMCMAANRYRGIRAALCHHEYEAMVARQHNDANFLCLGARVMGVDIAQKCLEIFLNSSFDQGRHTQRVFKLDRLCL